MTTPAVRPSPCESTKIRLEGALDAATAERLVTDLGRLPCAEVVVDLGRASTSDAELAFFAGRLMQLERPRVVLCGLRHHAQRLLVYVGAGKLLREAGAAEPGGA